MPAIETIRETIIPPFVATVLAILLATGLPQPSTVDAKPTLNDAPVTVLRDKQTDERLIKLCAPAREPAMPGLMLAVYRIPISGTGFGNTVQTGTIQFKRMTADVGIRCRQATGGFDLPEARWI